MALPKILLQGIAESVRCVMCLRTGVWPPRLLDVEETETMALHTEEDEQALLKKEQDSISMHGEIQKMIDEEKNDKEEGK